MSSPPITCDAHLDGPALNRCSIKGLDGGFGLSSLPMHSSWLRFSVRTTSISDPTKNQTTRTNVSVSIRPACAPLVFQTRVARVAWTDPTCLRLAVRRGISHPFFGVALHGLVDWIGRRSGPPSRPKNLLLPKLRRRFGPMETFTLIVSGMIIAGRYSSVSESLPSDRRACF
jgi:hypothetical protein